MGSKTLRRCSHGSVTEMNFLQTSFMVYLHWSLYEARDREYSLIVVGWASSQNEQGVDESGPVWQKHGATLWWTQANTCTLSLAKPRTLSLANTHNLSLEKPR